jgi:hypothetical protein
VLLRSQRLCVRLCAPGRCRQSIKISIKQCFFGGGGRRGTRTPKHFVNLTGESKNFWMLEFPLKPTPKVLWVFMWFVKFYVACAFIFSNLNYKMVIFLSQTESNPKHFFKKKGTAIKHTICRLRQIKIDWNLSSPVPFLALMQAFLPRDSWNLKFNKYSVLPLLK